MIKGSQYRVLGIAIALSASGLTAFSLLLQKYIRRKEANNPSNPSILEEESFSDLHRYCLSTISFLLLLSGYLLDAFSINYLSLSIVGGGTGSAARSRHFLRRYYTFLQRVKLGEVTLKHVPDEENPADFLTKPFKSAPSFFAMRAIIMNEPSPLTLMTVASGRANWAPIAAGKP